jgi:NADPH-dependent curcumin reductase CurA
MGAGTFKRVALAERPVGRSVRESDFRIEEAAIRNPAGGQVPVRAHYPSLDPGSMARRAEGRGF